MREAYSGPRTEEAFTRFEVLERRADLAEGHADSLLPPKSLEDEIAELRNEEKVNAELDAMKARLAAGRKA
jgi:phage shock protein A